MFQLLELIENEEDREFCRKLSEQFDSAMYHVAYGILKNSADAEDAVQESYIAIINNLDKISRENCHKAWNYIVTIVRSRAINVYRRRNRESKMDEDTIENLLQESQGDGEFFELPDGSSMSELIGRMKYPYKDVLYLRYYNELSYEEIATALDTTVDNARHISSRARKKLQEKVREGEFIMTEQELKDAITSACEADYKHAMAAPKHRFSRIFRKKIKVLLQPDMGKHTIPALYPVHGRRRVIVVVAVLVLLLGTTVMGRSFFQSLLGKYILTGYTDHVQLNLGEPENLEMVAIEDNEKNTMGIGAEPDSEEDFEFVCKKPQWVPEGYTLEREEYKEDFQLYQNNYVNNDGKYALYQQMRNDRVDNIGISSNGGEQQEVMIENFKGYFIPDDVLDEEKGNLVWEDGTYLYMMVGDLTKEELIRMAETIK